jgi:hypothetical protein
MRFGFNDEESYVNYAAEEGYLKAIIAAKDTEILDNEHLYEVCCRAARYGQLEIVKWYRGTGGKWDANMAADCANFNTKENMATLKWVVENGCPVNSTVMAMTISTFGYQGTDLLIWLREKGCSLSIDCWKTAVITCIYLTEALLLVLNWLYREECPYNKSVVTKALEMGNIAALRWFREKGYEYNIEECQQTIKMLEVKYKNSILLRNAKEWMEEIKQ